MMEKILAVVLIFIKILVWASVELLIISRLDIEIPYLDRLFKRFNLKELQKNGKMLDFLLLVLLILVTIYPIYFIFNNHLWSKISDVQTTGQFGDTINGISAPFIGLLGAILIYLTLRSQVNANKIQRDLNEYKNVLDTIELLNQNKNVIKKICNDAITDLNARRYQSDNIRLICIIIDDFLNTADMIIQMKSNQSALFKKFIMVWEFQYSPSVSKVGTVISGLVLTQGITFLIGNPTTFGVKYDRLLHVLRRNDI